MNKQQKIELANWLRLNTNVLEVERHLRTQTGTPKYLWKHEGARLSTEGIQKFIDKYSTKDTCSSVETKELVSAVKQPIDIVIAFDVTGSMSGYLAAVRKKVEDFVNTFIKNSNVLMRIVAFGDYCDPIDERFQSTSLTRDYKELVYFIENFRKTSGGDEPEFYEYVIKKVTETTEWRKDSKRIFILIGDYDPHGIGYTYGKEVVNNQIDWKEECKKALNKGITIDTLRMNDKSYSEWYEEAASITGGICVPFSNADKVEHVIKAMIFIDTDKEEFERQKAAVVKSGDKQAIETYKMVEEKRTKTQLAEIIANNLSKELTVCFHKTITEEYLTKVIQNYLDTHKTVAPKELSKLCIEGELTTMKCKISSLNKLGRYDVFDLIEKKMKQIDPRTIEYIELDNIKYKK